MSVSWATWWIARSRFSSLTRHPTFDADERELLRRVTIKYSPEIAHLVDVVDSRALTDKEREALRAGLVREFTSVGLKEGSEPNAYGVEVDDLIGRLMFF